MSVLQWFCCIDGYESFLVLRPQMSVLDVKAVAAEAKESGKSSMLVMAERYVTVGGSPMHRAFEAAKTAGKGIQHEVLQLYCPMCYQMASSACLVCKLASVACTSTPRVCQRCNACIHSTCLEPWIARYGTCPICDVVAAEAFT